LPAPRLSVLILAAVVACAAAAAMATAGAEAQALSGDDLARARFEHELLASHLELAREGSPYFTLRPGAGDLRLLVSGVVLSRFAAEKNLVAGRLRRALERREPGSIVARPFRWEGLDAGEAAGGVGSVSLRLDPPLRLDFEASPSDFFWRWLRFNLVDRFGGKSKPEGMSVVLFYHPETLATLTPLLADTLPVLLLPEEMTEPAATAAR
jgi:hypothetical protein